MLAAIQKNELFQGLKVQRRVVWALMMRETKTLFGKHKLGYLWAVINAAFQVGIFWIIRAYGGFQSPHGMSTPVFLIGGFIPWYLFSNGVTNGLQAIWANRSLLTFPQVFPFDLILARLLLQGAVQTLVMILLLGFAMGIGQHVAVAQPHAIFLGLFFAQLLGLGVGTVCSGLNLMNPVVSQLVPIVLRFMFFTSGVFFSVADLPSNLQDILAYNPVSHLLECTRAGFVDGYAHNFIDLTYVAGIILCSLTFGLLLERYSRNYLDRMI